MNDSRVEVLQSLDGFVGDAIPQLTMTEDDYWQPSDFLPDLGTPEGLDDPTMRSARFAPHFLRPCTGAR